MYRNNSFSSLVQMDPNACHHIVVGEALDAVVCVLFQLFRGPMDTIFTINFAPNSILIVVEN